jgi:UDP-glucose 4-epimerase
MTKCALVTGGAGFIGSTVADYYLAEGYEVTVIDDLSTGVRENVPKDAEFVECDIGSPEARQVLESRRFEVLNHHAAQIDVRISVSDPQLDARINILGLLNLLEGARAGGTDRVLLASSGGVVYGESDDLPHPEGAIKLPVSPYGVAKLTSEFYLAAYAQLYGMKVVSLRYANVYGPRQNPHGEAGVVAIFCNRIRSGSAITIFGDGSQTRDYVHVHDVARANMAATKWEVPTVSSIDSVAVNVGTATETSVTELAQKLIEVTGSPVSIEHQAARPGELQRSAVAIDRAGKDLGWQPQYTLDQGLLNTYEWITEHAG